MPGSPPKVFVSYSSEDIEEVEQLDLELRRRGVPLWRDRVNLAAGRPSEPEIQRASDEAAGFLFYLTSNAAASDWVRENELPAARKNAARNPSFGIVPIFREEMDTVSKEMIRLGAGPGGGAAAPSPYDLRPYTGYIVRSAEVARGRINGELRAAAERVLQSLLLTVRDRAAPGERLKIGLATRGGPGLGNYDLDLLVDWTVDYANPDDLPDPLYGKGNLLPALDSLWRCVSRHGPTPSLRLVPQCHLSMAFAAGFQFRSTTGADLEVIEIHSGDAWHGPAVPAEGLLDAWTIHPPEAGAPGTGGIAVIVGVSQSITAGVKSYLGASGAPAEKVLVFEPAAGATRTALQGIGRLVAHRMIRAVVDALRSARAEMPTGPVHLFFAGPPAFAVLFGQQLSNVGPVQTYEWSDSSRTYRPSFLLRSS